MTTDTDRTGASEWLQVARRGTMSNLNASMQVSVIGCLVTEVTSEAGTSAKTPPMLWL